jgi:hypothetical protein
MADYSKNELIGSTQDSRTQQIPMKGTKAQEKINYVS